MPEPIYSEATETFYERLPEHYRNADAGLNWVFKKWLSGVLEEYADVDDLITRFQYTTLDSGGIPGDTSDLTDPATADAAWLPWLAQLVGINLDVTLPVADQRTVISQALLGIKAGTKAAMAQAASRHLVGSKFVRVYDHSSSLSAIGQGGEWDMLVVTLDSETLENTLTSEQAIMGSNTAWTPDVYLTNNVGPSAWTTTGYTASTGSTNPLLTSYTTFDGSGNSYVSGNVKAGVPYYGRMAFRNGSVSPTGLVMRLQFFNASNTLVGETADIAITPVATWVWYRTATMTAPAGAVTCRLRVASTAGDYAVSNWMVTSTPDSTYFKSTDPGVTTIDTNWTMPPANWAYNSSYDENGGWTVTNGSLARTTDRFKYNSSSALLTASGSDPFVHTGVVPLYEGERVRVKVQALSKEAGTATNFRLRIVSISSTGVVTTQTQVDVTPTNLDFVELSVTWVATADIKEVRAELVFVGAVNGSQYYVDGWLITKGESVFTYFDGNTQGCSWDNVNVTLARTIGSRTSTPLLISRSDIADSGVLQNTVTADGAIVTWASKFANYVAVTATDTYTAMLTAVAMQAGSYVGVLEAIFYDNSDAVTGFIRSAGVAVGQTPVRFTVTGVAPASSTRMRLKFYVYGGIRGNIFGIAQGGTRLGTQTEWVAETADPIQDILDAGAKPAGVKLYSDTAQTQWSQIESEFPLWPDWEGAGGWGPIEESGF